MGHMDRYCKSHPDFHAPAHVAVGGELDGREYGRRLSESGADTVVIFAKGHYGFSYYPTEVGTPHPRLQKDMVAEVVNGCHAHDVAVVAYFSTFLDTAAVEQHPDWGARNRERELGAGKYGRVCLNSPYVEELLIPQGKELLEQYDVDEIFYDTMSRFKPCYCDHCREQFGRPVPDGPEDESWLEYAQWYYGRFKDFFARVSREMHAVRDVPCCFNWMWCASEPLSPPEGIDGLLGDDQSGGESASLNCRYWAGVGLPFEYMTGRFVAGLGDWSSRTPTMLRHTAAASIANGGGYWLIDRMLPDGSLQEEAYEAMAAPFQFVRRRLDYVHGARPVPEIGVLNGWTHLAGPDLRYFPDYEERQRRGLAYRGASEMLTRRGRHFTGLNEDALVERAGDYRLIVVPEHEFLRDDVKGALREYVEGGGCLLITQSAGAEPVPEMLQLAGVAVEGYTEADHGYFAGDRPVLQRTPFARIEPKTAEPLGAYLLPVGGGAQFGHGYAPPEREGDFPAVTVNRCGRGRVIYVGAPVFESYHRYADHHIAGVVLKLIDRLLPDPVVRLHGPPNVETSVMRRGEDLIVHLVNHNARERTSAGYVAAEHHMPELRDVRLDVRAAPGVQRVLCVPDERELPWRESAGYVELVLPRLHIMESLLVPGYFHGTSNGGEEA
ncbi:MAG: alpha-L-fucosidase [Planctomycetota bacterium]